jgi:uncharacterized protein (TIGR02300 family)
VVAKPQWGLKRTCQSCGARFYDLGRAPIACPKCGAAFDAEVMQKSRRVKAVAAPRAPVPVAVEPEEAPAIEEAAVGEEAEATEEKEEAVIEDTSELGEDEEDVAEVVDKVDDEER